MGGAASPNEHELVLDVLTIAEPAFAANGDHRIVAWNDAAERLLGIAAGDVIGARCSDALEARSGALCANCEVCPEALARAPRQEMTVAPLGRPERQARMTALTAHTAGGQTRIVHLLRAAPSPVQEAPRPPAVPAASDSRLPRPTLLTTREYEVLRLLGAGHSTDQIAGELSITRVTARNHVNKVLDKLGASSRLQAVVIASQLRLI
jgi:DNA-binding CsgD family transcriptional regulator